MCPILDNNKTYFSGKWIFDDKNVFIVCDVERKLNEWIKLFKNTLKFHQTLFIKRDALSERALPVEIGIIFMGLHTKI